MKKIHQLKQWTNEKVGRSKKTEMDEELKQLISETDLQREYFERLQKTLADYIHIYDKKIDTQEEKKIYPVNAIGLLTINFGTIFPASSAFGQALLRYGEAHTKLSENQSDFVSRSRRGFENYLTNFSSEMKNYSQLKKKYDRRRLDLDEIQERVKKSSKEKPQLVQELRVSQDKYEESLDELTRKIFDLNNKNNRHIESLKDFCLSELEYHRGAVEILTDTYNSICELHEEEGSYDNYSTNLSSNPTTDGRNIYNSYSRKSSYSSYQNSLNQDINNSRSNSSSYSPATTPIYESPSLRSSSISQASAAIPRQQTVAQKPQRQVRANFDFTAEADNELSMKAGDIINVITEIDEGWWQGEMADGSGRIGIFPQNYTTEITPQVQTKESISSATTTNTYNNSVNEVTQSLANTSMDYNNNAFNRKTSSVAAELQQKIAAGNSYRNSTNVLPRSETNNSNSSANNVGVCGTCGCSDYALNVFKPPLCNNCFHQH